MKSLNEILLTPYGEESLIPSPVNRMMSSFASDFREGTDINLGVGYVNEDTIPRQLILQCLGEVINAPEKHRSALNYGGPRGSENLIRSLREYRQKRLNLPRELSEKKEIIIGASGATSLLKGFSEVLPPGIVITSDPLYYIYTDLLERKGFTIAPVAEDNQGIIPEKVEEMIYNLEEKAGEIRFFYIVSVNNPTSSVLGKNRKKQLVDIVSALCRKQNRKIPLLFDNAYEDLIHAPGIEPPVSAFLFDELDIVYEMGTLSKILAPALRIGYLAGPGSSLLQSLVQHINDTGFSAPMICQEISSRLLDYHITGQLARVNAGYRKKAEEIGQAIHSTLGPLLENCCGGDAGFYFYLTFKELQTNESAPFFRRLTRTTGDEKWDGRETNPFPRVIYLPGEYCVHSRGTLKEKGTRQLRLSYGYEETPRIIESIRLMKDAAEG